jgi:hypothetical protein
MRGSVSDCQFSCNNAFQIYWLIPTNVKAYSGVVSDCCGTDQPGGKQTRIDNDGNDKRGA